MSWPNRTQPTQRPSSDSSAGKTTMTTVMPMTAMSAPSAPVVAYTTRATVAAMVGPAPIAAAKRFDAGTSVYVRGMTARQLREALDLD